MLAPLTLAVDAMSGDHGHTVAIDAVLRALATHPSLSVILTGDEALLSAHLETKRVHRPRVSIEHASQVVAMDEVPSKALRGKRDSSMRVAIDLVKQGKAQAAVSAGNTGALMGMANFVLKTLPGIDRPAIISPLPTLRGATYVLDLGANSACTSEQLCQFAMMGSALVTTISGIAKPRVALLNIGEEEIKGNETIKRAAVMLAASKLNYVGYIEGDGIFLYPVDVVVCDGFIGNITLKAGEGVAKLIMQFMREEFTRNRSTKLIAMLARPVLKALSRRIDPRRYNGASFVGLQGIVVKSHGSADATAFANAIDVAVRQVQLNLPSRIRAQLIDNAALSAMDESRLAVTK